MIDPTAMLAARLIHLAHKERKQAAFDKLSILIFLGEKGTERFSESVAEYRSIISEADEQRQAYLRAVSLYICEALQELELHTFLVLMATAIDYSLEHGWEPPQGAEHVWS